MTKRTPLYDPPLNGGQPIEEIRDHLFAGPDNDLFLHVGHFLVWFASAEYIVTMMLHAFFKSDPVAFNALVKGMDCRTKIGRLYELCDHRGISIPPDLDARLDHLSREMANLRNKLAHNFPYWDDGRLQICTLGAPPDIGVPFPAPAPESISSLDLFEKSLWLKAFTYDLGPIHQRLFDSGKIQISGWNSGLPRGHQPRQPRKARAAKHGKRRQTRP